MNFVNKGKAIGKRSLDKVTFSQMLGGTNADAASAAYRDLHTEIMFGSREGKDNYKKWCAVESISGKTSYEATFGSRLLRPEKVLGDKQKSAIRANKLNVPVELWHLTVPFSTVEAMQDAAGLPGKLKAALADGSDFINSVVITQLETNPLTYDGLAFFHSSHLYGGTGGTTFDNTGTSAFSTDALLATDDLMRAFKDESGRSRGVRPDTIIHGSAISSKVREAIGATLISSGSTNMAMGKYLAIEEPLLVDTDGWYLVDSKQKPVAVGVAQQPEPYDTLGVYRDDGTVLFSSEAQLAIAYVAPWAMYQQVP